MSAASGSIGECKLLEQESGEKASTTATMRSIPLFIKLLLLFTTYSQKQHPVLYILLTINGWNPKLVRDLHSTSCVIRLCLGFKLLVHSQLHWLTPIFPTDKQTQTAIKVGWSSDRTAPRLTKVDRSEGVWNEHQPVLLDFGVVTVSISHSGRKPIKRVTSAKDSILKCVRKIEGTHNFGWWRVQFWYSLWMCCI